MDDVLIANMKKKGLHPKSIAMLPEGKGWLLCEFGGETKEESNAKARALMDTLSRQPDPPNMKLFIDEQETLLVWKARESGLGATSHVPGEPEAWEGWEDAAVPPEKLGEYLRDSRIAAGQVRLPLRALRPLRRGLRPHAHRLRSGNGRGHQGFPRFRGRSRGHGRAAMAARFPASMATARRAASCCQRCLAPS